MQNELTIICSDSHFDKNFFFDAAMNKIRFFEHDSLSARIIMILNIGSNDLFHEFRTYYVLMDLKSRLQDFSNSF